MTEHDITDEDLYGVPDLDETSADETDAQDGDIEGPPAYATQDDQEVDQ